VTDLTEYKGIQIVVEKLQEINHNIGDSNVYLKLAPTKYPATLETGIMPICLVVPQAGTSLSRGSSRETTRDYALRTYVSPTGQNAFDNPIQISYLLLQAFLQTYLDRVSSTVQSLILDTGETSEYRIELLPYQTRPITDTGVVSDLEYTREDVTYWGFEMTLGITMEWPITC
jgi:hypothetical protein